MSRFLTGFEILLTQCHEWEQNAHSGVSISEHLLNITHQIISWRKLELNMWKDSLNITFERMNESISKWWFYIYDIVNNFMENFSISTKDLIENLQKFIIQSNLAEFENRLGLLYTFHCHVVHLKSNVRSESLISILWNMYKYFEQFLPGVKNKIKELRAPIEKKLKDYVKIVKWKDVSYWAVKETLEKTHKTLHKYMREFENIINQPVQPYFVNSSSMENIENIGIWDRPQRVSPKYHHWTLDPSTYVAKNSLFKVTILNV